MTQSNDTFSVGHRDLFSSPLFGFEILNAPMINEELIKDIENRRLVEEGISVSNQLGWHSQRDLFKRKEDSFQALNAEIVKALRAVSAELCKDFETSEYDMHCEGWFNVNGKGAFNAPHDHNSFHLSGCYYVNVPTSETDRSGNIEFLDPRSLSWHVGDADMPFLNSKVRIRPKAGLLLIFPAYLRHWVYPNQEDEDRISIAFNARLVRRSRSPAKSPEGEPARD